MIRECLDFLRANAPAWEVPAQGEWKFVFHNNYHPHCSNINLLWFHGHDGFPAVVAKVFRESGVPAREHCNQLLAWNRAPFCVPQPLFFGQHGTRFWALWMKGVRGVPLTGANTRERQTLTSVTDTIVRMHAAFGMAVGKDTRYRHVVEEPVKSVTSFGDMKVVLDGCAALAAECSPEWLRSVPVIPQHGDLFAGNIVGGPQDYYMVDWETLNQVDLPFYDMITMLLSCLRTAGDNPDGWNRATREQTAPLLAWYAHRLKLSTNDVRKLLPLTLLNWFHIQLKDGRANFCERMYGTLASYFQNRARWEKVFVPGEAITHRQAATTH